jgi:hypothetical protein
LLISNNVSPLVSGGGYRRRRQRLLPQGRQTGSESIEAREADLRLLPQYSPDLNPIASVFRPLKTRLRKAAKRTVNGSQRCVGSFISRTQAFPARSYFRTPAMVMTGTCWLFARPCNEMAREHESL